MASKMQFSSSTLFLALLTLLLLHASPVAAFGAGNIGKGRFPLHTVFRWSVVQLQYQRSKGTTGVMGISKTCLRLLLSSRVISGRVWWSKEFTSAIGFGTTAKQWTWAHSKGFRLALSVSSSGSYHFWYFAYPNLLVGDSTNIHYCPSDTLLQSSKWPRKD